MVGQDRDLDSTSSTHELHPLNEAQRSSWKWKGRRYDKRARGNVTIHEIQSGQDDLSRRETRKRKTKASIVLSVTLLSLSALLPAIMGTLFYLSVGFSAPDAVYYPNNSTFVRPTNEGVEVGGKNSFITSHFSPLLLSSLSSSLITFVSPLVMALLAYHVAALWLRESSIPGTTLPDTAQYHLSLSLVTNPTPFSFLHYLAYQWGQFRRSSRITSEATHRKTTSILSLTAAGALIVLILTWSIRVIDIVLHEQIVSTTLRVRVPGPAPYAAHATVASQCQNGTFNHCPVRGRTNIASKGGNNRSSVFHVYEYDPDNVNRQQRIAFIGPTDAGVHTYLNFTTHTYAASTECQVYHPVCTVRNDNIVNCKPGTGSSSGAWDQFVFNTGFNVTTWQNRLQTFLTRKGSLTDTNPGQSYALTNAANANPFTTASFGCFADYANIQYDDHNTDNTTFINWWSYGAGNLNQPYQLCSISVCNTTVHDAQYTLLEGEPTLRVKSLKPANGSAVVAVSGAGMYLGTADTSYYPWAPRYIDDQIQLDLSDFGNNYGNNATQFAQQWAQSLSNRYLGWAAGAIQLTEINATRILPRISTSIPLVTAHLFAILHFVYALAIVLLGVSCLWLQKTGRLSNYTAHDLQSAQARLSDTGVVVRELARRGQHTTQKISEGRESSLDSRSSQEHDSSALRGDLRTSNSFRQRQTPGHSESEDDAIVALEKGPDGEISLRFHKE